MTGPDQRRRLLLAAVGGAPLLARAGSDAPAVRLARAKWADRARQAIEALVARHGNQHPGYQAARAPYAVFDWDNTAIMNDTEEALFMYQINRLAFRLTPAEFSAIVRQDVPAGAFGPAFRNAAGGQVTLEAIGADLDQRYAWLHRHYAGMGGTEALGAITAGDQFLDFRARLYFLYEAINATHGPAVGYPWVLNFFANLTRSELAALAEESNDDALGDAIAKSTLASPAGLAGQAGAVSITYTRGLRLTLEIAGLMELFREHGIEVYVSTASLEDVVRVFACLPKYGYRVAPENVIGMRLEMDGQRYLAQRRRDWPLNWGPGKSANIRSELALRKGYGPLFVAGDSDGDYDMLRDFPDTELGLLVNRLKKGKIGSLCRIAAETGSGATPRYVLQGRIESSGEWQPLEETLALGQKQARLLA
jgi:hypothetical protein